MTKAIVIAGFVLAFAAGLVAGIQWRRPACGPMQRPSGPSGWLAAELNLTAAQKEQLNEIWSETAKSGRHDREDRCRQLNRERDEAIAGLIRPEDKPRYDEIVKKSSDRADKLEQEWRRSFESAVERTKQILTPDQRVKYEEILQRHQKERGSRPRHHGDMEYKGDRKKEPAASTPAGSQPKAGESPTRANES
ncbi:MAG TPA: periplasmic heavy metal sensor [Phycisphaerae bacterium]|nr:periplasmic heavy metal sensor [Phycisphaerae bacterium]